MEFMDYSDRPEILTEYDEDVYDQVKEEVDYDYDPDFDFAGMMSFNEIMQQCIEPTVKDALRQIGGQVIAWCVFYRIVTQATKLPAWLAHFISAVIGIVVLAQFFFTNILFQIGLTFISWIALHFSHRLLPGNSRGFFAAFISIGFNAICELKIPVTEHWHQIRGVQMVLTMKLVSVAFDIDTAVKEASERVSESKDDNNDENEKEDSSAGSSKKARRRKPPASQTSKSSAEREKDKEPVEDPKTRFDLTRVPSFLEYFGYALNPGTTFFGPWVSYTDYLYLYENPRWNPTWLVKIILTMMFSFMFLTLSSCWITWFIPEQNAKWVLAYKHAMAYRSSHYFVSFAAEAGAIAAGFGCSVKGNEVGRVTWSLPVAEPHNVEVPRSLNEVVTSWNKPMHTWLKKYCFKKTIRFGVWFAILATYTASTLLHGFNFQLGATLLSLGFFTYTEHELRRKFARIFNASIEAKSPKTQEEITRYRHKEGNFVVMLANMGFGLLAIVHLMYLGVMFDQSNLQEEGYNWRHTMEKWDQLGFFSHIYNLVAFTIAVAL